MDPQQEIYNFEDLQVILTHVDTGLWTFVFFKDKLHPIMNT